VGLVTAQRRVLCSAETLVHPRILDARDWETVDRDIAAAAERFKTRSYNEDPYHYQLREYSPGQPAADPLEADGAAGRAVVRISERRPHAEQTLIVDDIADHYPPGDTEAFETVLDRVASTAHHLVFSKGCRVIIIGLLTGPVSVDLRRTDERAAVAALVETREPRARCTRSAGAHPLHGGGGRAEAP